MKENLRSTFYRMKDSPKSQRFLRSAQRSMEEGIGLMVLGLAACALLAFAIFTNGLAGKIMTLSLVSIILLMPRAVCSLLSPSSKKAEEILTTVGQMSQQEKPTPESTLGPTPAPVPTAPQEESLPENTSYLSTEEVGWIVRNLTKLQVQANNDKNQSYRNTIYAQVVEEFSGEPEHIQISRFSADITLRVIERTLAQSYKQATKYHKRGAVEKREKLFEKIMFLENMKRKFDDLLNPKDEEEGNIHNN